MSEYEKQFIRDRFMDGKDYIPRSYFDGATPENDYQPSNPLTLTICDNPYSYQNQGYAKLFLKSGGADSPREIVLRQAKDSKWYLWDQFLLAGIRAPEREIHGYKNIDTVTETIKKLINGEEVENYVAPATPEEAPGADSPKKWLTCLLLLIFLGGLGFHRYYVGKIGTGFLWMITVGLFGIGWLVDLIKLLTGKFTDKNGNVLKRD